MSEQQRAYTFIFCRDLISCFYKFRCGSRASFIEKPIITKSIDISNHNNSFLIKNIVLIWW